MTGLAKLRKASIRGGKSQSQRRGAFERAFSEQKKKMLPANCGVCRSTVYTGNGTLHHKKRRSQGGDNSTDNLMPVHHVCHEYVHKNVAIAKGKGWVE